MAQEDNDHCASRSLQSVSPGDDVIASHVRSRASKARVQCEVCVCVAENAALHTRKRAHVHATVVCVCVCGTEIELMALNLTHDVTLCVCSDL